jgi:hypothetical protein
MSAVTGVMISTPARSNSAARPPVHLLAAHPVEKLRGSHPGICRVLAALIPPLSLHAKKLSVLDRCARLLLPCAPSESPSAFRVR